MGRVAVVTDSTADLPADLAEERDIRVVPMSVAFGTETFISRITISDEEFYERLAAARVLPTTAQPAPVWFQEAYGDAADSGYDAVVSIHVSAALSGTVDLARRYAEQASLPVRVVDSRQVGGALALMVLDACRAAAAEADVDEVADVACRTRDAVRSLLVVDTLDYLKRGGRLSGAQALVGRALRVKPLLGVVDGRVEVVERTRTWGRALERLASLAQQHAAERPARAVVTHALDPDRAEQVWGAVDDRVEITDRLETVAGPIVGTHTGPGAVALAIAPAR